MVTKKREAILEKLNGYIPPLSGVGPKGSKERKDYEREVAYLVMSYAADIHRDLSTPEGKTGTNFGTWNSMLNLCMEMQK
jgi:hypothetical protein